MRFECNDTSISINIERIKGWASKESFIKYIIRAHPHLNKQDLRTCINNAWRFAFEAEDEVREIEAEMQEEAKKDEKEK